MLRTARSRVKVISASWAIIIGGGVCGGGGGVSGSPPPPDLPRIAESVFRDGGGGATQIVPTPLPNGTYPFSSRPSPTAALHSELVLALWRMTGGAGANKCQTSFVGGAGVWAGALVPYCPSTGRGGSAQCSGGPTGSMGPDPPPPLPSQWGGGPRTGGPPPSPSRTDLRLRPVWGGGGACSCPSDCLAARQGPARAQRRPRHTAAGPPRQRDHVSGPPRRSAAPPPPPPPPRATHTTTEEGLSHGGVVRARACHANGVAWQAGPTPWGAGAQAVIPPPPPPRTPGGRGILHSTRTVPVTAGLFWRNKIFRLFSFHSGRPGDYRLQDSVY